MNSGMNEMIGTVDSNPIRLAAQPHWKTITSTPYAAATLSRFSTAALSGTRMERKATISSRNDIATTATRKIGSRSSTRSAEVGHSGRVTTDMRGRRAARQRGGQHLSAHPVERPGRRDVLR